MKIGEVSLSKAGQQMEIIKILSYPNVLVEFEDGYKKECTYTNFKKGSVLNPYMPRASGIGYIGEGDGIAKINGKHTRVYKTWVDMIWRCYSEKAKIKYTWYKGCTVCKEWHNFQNFYIWYQDNYYEVDGNGTYLDKDILVKGNKIYSPSTCVFVPRKINNLIRAKRRSTGQYLPVGIQKRNNIYVVYCSDEFGKIHNLGKYENINEGVTKYNKFKKQVIVNMANIYKDKIPNRLYESLIAYKL